MRENKNSVSFCNHIQKVSILSFQTSGHLFIESMCQKLFIFNLKNFFRS